MAGLSEDQIAENAGRSVAQLVLQALAAAAIAAGRAFAPTVAVLAGCHRRGEQAIVAGRHLANHGVNVLLCLAEPEPLGLDVRLPRGEGRRGWTGS